MNVYEDFPFKVEKRMSLFFQTSLIISHIIIVFSSFFVNYPILYRDISFQSSQIDKDNLEN